MSAKGVVHVHAAYGGSDVSSDNNTHQHLNQQQPSEFVALADWAREAAQFNAVSALPFFKHALPRKAFLTWRANVRFNRYRKQHAALARALFPWKPAFVGAMREITSTLSRVACLPLLDLTSSSSPNSGSSGSSAGVGGAAAGGAGAAQRYASVQAFAEAQQAARSDALKLLEREINTIHVAVERVCEDVVARAHACEAGDADPYGDNVLVKTREAKMKSMAALRAEAEAKASALAAAAEEEAKLGPFVRLVDYLLVETIAGLFVTQLQRLQAELCEPSLARQSCGMFATTLRFDVDEGALRVPAALDLNKILPKSSSIASFPACTCAGTHLTRFPFPSPP